mmetsp:Transcript_27909/g.91498  ORF Transcript_27909/g.91498 Transcript_27909/m.91498 type:complete len:251 (-) Transcript_27909:179-931(-)
MVTRAWVAVGHVVAVVAAAPARSAAMSVTFMDFGGPASGRDRVAARSAIMHAAPPWRPPMPLQCAAVTSMVPSPRNPNTSSAVSPAAPPSYAWRGPRSASISRSGNVARRSGEWMKRSCWNPRFRNFAWRPSSKSRSPSSARTSQAKKANVRPCFKSRVSTVMASSGATTAPSTTSALSVMDRPALPSGENSARPPNVEHWSRIARSAPSGAAPSGRAHHSGTRARTRDVVFVASRNSTGPPNSVGVRSR